jgi:hypothetical protein
MADTHAYFYSTDTEKQTLHRRVVPNAAQFLQQQERWNDLRDYLVDVLSEKTGLAISSWLQGSYKFGTQVRPKNQEEEFDIDLGIYFKWSDSAEAGDYGPLQLKQLIQESLVQYAAETQDTTEVLDPPKDRCNRISFTEGFHIDVPVYHLNEQTDIRSLATEDDEWEDSDPTAIYLWFREQFSDEDSNQVRRLIRYMKMWSSLNLDTPPSSIMLTVLVAEAYSHLQEGDLTGDDNAVLSVAKSIYSRLEQDVVVGNPVDSSENLNRLSDLDHYLFMEKLDSLCLTAERAIAADNKASSASIWSELFGHFFPAPANETVEDDNITALTNVLFVPRVRVTATSKTNSSFSTQDINRLGPIPRDCAIEFVLLNQADLPTDAHLQWIVRNEGEEAEIINDLGHHAGVNERLAREGSAYNGSHFMDVIVTIPMQGVVGFARIPIVISFPAVPPRNPKKPGYTRIRRKR